MGEKGNKSYFPAAARILMGLVFFVFGLNGFHPFIPQPANLPDRMMAFFGAMGNTGYMLPLVFATQMAVGVLLLVNRFVPLALVLIAPVIVHIIAFHIFLQPAGIVPGIIVLALEVYLVRSYWSSLRGIFVARAKPDVR
jgi:uncharacterized membrane protein YphA (DoxX/SURF4 family)